MGRPLDILFLLYALHDVFGIIAESSSPLPADIHQALLNDIVLGYIVGGSIPTAVKNCSLVVPSPMRETNVSMASQCIPQSLISHLNLRHVAAAAAADSNAAVSVVWTTTTMTMIRMKPR
mmetsp:Transcript_29173/g.40402  ORF Transcript_29173/g.40402 Transcript_29173/m.40402 type:complete len:120 (-) Transcript_29173:186-545(-)